MINQIRTELSVIFELLPDQTVADWAHDNIILPPGQGADGNTSPSWHLTPDIPFILEMVKNPDVREIDLAFSSQSGKTLFLICAVAWLIKHVPIGDIMWVLPDAKLIERVGRDRVRPIYERSNIGIMPGRYAKSKTTLRFELLNLYFALASKSSDLSSNPIPFVIFDEEDENPALSSGSASPEKLAQERQRTFRHCSKLLRACVPRKVERGIYPAVKKARNYKLHVKCLRCQKHIELKFKQIKWAKDKEGHSLDPEIIKRDHLAWYECQLCGGRIEDHERHDLLSTQHWHCMTPGRPMTKVGFHKPVYYSAWETWSSMAAEFLDSKDDIPKMQNFQHGWMAEPQDVSKKEIREDELKQALYLPYLRGNIPDDCICITAGADTGDEDIHLAFVAWGIMGEWWKIYSERIKGKNFESALAEFENAIKKDFGGKKIKFVGGAIDAGGHNADKIYRFCLRNRLWIATHGSGPTSAPWTVNPVMVGPKENKRNLGINLYTFNDRYFQDILQGYLSKERGNGPNCAHIPENCSDTFLKHLTNEVLKVAPDRSGRVYEHWVARFSGAPQHFRDALKIAILRAYTLGVYRLREEPRDAEAEKVKHEARVRAQQQNSRRQLSNRL